MRWAERAGCELHWCGGLQVIGALCAASSEHSSPDQAVISCCYLKTGRVGDSEAEQGAERQSEAGKVISDG